MPKTKFEIKEAIKVRFWRQMLEYYAFPSYNVGEEEGGWFSLTSSQLRGAWSLGTQKIHNWITQEK